MTSLVIYLLKVLLIQAVCFGVYRLFFSSSKKHHWNRMFLLSSLIGAFVIPFVELPAEVEQVTWTAQPVETWVSAPDDDFFLIPISSESESWLDLGKLFQLAYLVVGAWLLGRSIFYLIFIQKLKYRSKHVKYYWFRLFKTNRIHAFSFFRDIFIPARLYRDESFDQVLAHECEHARQHHSVDRLLLDLMISLFWFNPFIYWYRNALIEIHEYQADEAAIRQSGDPVRYQEALFAQLQISSHSPLVSHFNFSTIKKRIVMINKQNKKSERWKYSLILPLIGAIVFSFSSKEVVAPLETAGMKISKMAGPFPESSIQAFSTLELFEDNYIPSILPLDADAVVRKSSGFGQRRDPISKEQKFHSGMDFAAPRGTKVISAADGKVVYTRNHPNGYGKHILIQHGDTYQTKYAQLSEMLVSEGDLVKKGEVIGKVGSSGRSTAPHLHYEIMKNDKPVDPEDYIEDYDFVNPKPSKKSTGQIDEPRPIGEVEPQKPPKPEPRPDSVPEPDMPIDQHKLAKAQMLAEKAQMEQEKVQRKLEVEQQKLLATQRKMEQENQQLEQNQRELGEAQRLAEANQLRQQELQRELEWKKKKEKEKEKNKLKQKVKD